MCALGDSYIREGNNLTKRPQNFGNTILTPKILCCPHQFFNFGIPPLSAIKFLSPVLNGQ